MAKKLPLLIAVAALLVLAFGQRGAGGALAATSCAANPIGGPLGWTAKTAPPSGVEGATGVIIGSKLYVTHGYTSGFGDDIITQIYDLTADSWSSGASAAVARSELTGVCALESGTAKVFALGGRFGSALSTVEMYDPVANSWSARAPMLTARAGLGAATDPATNKIYAIGGRTGTTPHTGTPLAVNETYDPTLNVWTTKAPMPTAMMDIYSTVYFNGKIYVIGGFDGTNVSTLVQIYDPAGNSWSTGAPMPTARSNLIAGVCGSRIYAIGGYDGSGNLTTNEVYDPALNTWTAAQPSKPTASSELASAVISTGQDIFAVGSGIFGQAQAINEVFTCASPPTATPTAVPPTATPTAVPPTATPTPRPVLGGVAERPDFSSGAGAGLWAALAAGLIGTLVLGAGGLAWRRRS